MTTVSVIAWIVVSLIFVGFVQLQGLTQKKSFWSSVCWRCFLSESASGCPATQHWFYLPIASLALSSKNGSSRRDWYTKTLMLHLQLVVRKSNALLTYRKSERYYPPLTVMDGELQNRTHQASKAVGQLCSRVFPNWNLSTTTNASLYNAICLSILLYGSESWTPYRAHIRTLETLHNRSLKRILGLSWRDWRQHINIL